MSAAALAMATEYVKRGWSVFPLKPRTKKPATLHGFKDATRDTRMVRNWFDNDAGFNIGIATGAPSGFFAMDVDPRHSGDETLGALERRYGPLPETIRALTGGADQGQHILFRQPEGVKLASALGDGIEIKADGGYIVAAPSIHPDSGRAYRWDVGALPSETTLVDPPAWLLDALTREDRPLLHPIDGADAADSVIGHAFELAGMLGGPLPGGKRMVRCPWLHEHSDGRGDGRDSSTVVLPPTTPAKWGVFVCSHAHCAGRGFNAAMTALPTEHVQAARAKYRRPASDAQSRSGPSSWGEAQPFDSVKLPGFPVDALPRWLATWVRDVAEFAQVPEDLPATVGLGVFSFAASRVARVQVFGGWTEPLNLYCVTALPPGERKSPVFALATDAVSVYQRELCAELSPQIARRQLERGILQDQIDAAKTKAAKGEASQRAASREEALALAKRLQDLPELYVPTLVADDCTPEALAILLAQSGERVGVFSAEGGPFEIMAGRYSERANLEIYLKAHPGDRHAVARVKREPLTLERPLLSMALTVQPTVIQGLAQKDGFRGKGLLARFLYSLPVSRMGERMTDVPAIPEDVAEAYGESLLWLLRLPTEETTFVFSADADHARKSFQKSLEPRLGVDGDLRPIADWAGKLVGAVCRIAGILHIAEHARAADIPTTVSVETFLRAEQIGLYFLDHARAAFESMGSDDATELAKRLWAWTQRCAVGEFSEREAQRAGHRDSKETGAALEILLERNLIRKVTGQHETGGRPASPRFEVRPAQ